MKLITQNSVETDFYIDTMIVQTLLADTGLSKFAGVEEMGSELIDKVKGYIDNKVDPENKTASVLAALAPGALLSAMKAMGFGWLATLFSLAASFFHIDIKNILTSIWEGLHSAIGGGKLTSSSAIDSIVQSAVHGNVQPATEAEATAAVKGATFSQARMVKLAMIEYEQSINKSAASIFDKYKGQKSATSNVLVTILSWVFKIALTSAGLMVAGDVMHEVLGQPNALTGGVQKGKVVEQPAAPAGPTSTQTKFKVQPTYRDDPKTGGNWVVNVANNVSSIESLLVLFAKQVYQGLDGLESKIVNEPKFQALRNSIVSYNKSSAGDPIVVIPSHFTTKKQIVDYFIDDVAKEAP